MHTECYTTELQPQVYLQGLERLFKHIQQKENQQPNLK